MNGARSARDPRDRDDLTLEIISTLEACGLEPEDYMLHDYVDTDALETLLQTSQDVLTIRFSVEGIPLLVTKDDVRVLLTEQYDTTHTA